MYFAMSREDYFQYIKNMWTDVSALSKYNTYCDALEYIAELEQECARLKQKNSKMITIREDDWFVRALCMLAENTSEN